MTTRPLWESKVLNRITALTLWTLCIRSSAVTRLKDPYHAAQLSRCLLDRVSQMDICELLLQIGSNFPSGPSCPE